VQKTIAFFIPVDENHLKTGVYEVCHQRAVVPSNRFNALAVHLVMNLRLREVQPSVTFLVDKQIRKINLKPETLIVRRKPETRPLTNLNHKIW